VTQEPFRRLSTTICRPTFKTVPFSIEVAVDIGRLDHHAMSIDARLSAQVAPGERRLRETLSRFAVAHV
jgi:hypothetical protein